MCTALPGPSLGLCVGPAPSPPTASLLDSGPSLALSVSFLWGQWLSDSAPPLPLQAHWTMPENVLMGIRRGLSSALVLSISFCSCELSHSALDFSAPEHGSGQGATSNLWVDKGQLRRPISEYLLRDFKGSPFSVGYKRGGPTEGRGRVRTGKHTLGLERTLGEVDMPAWVTVYTFLTQIHLPRGDP